MGTCNFGLKFSAVGENVSKPPWRGNFFKLTLYIMTMSVTAASLLIELLVCVDMHGSTTKGTVWIHTRAVEHKVSAFCLSLDYNGSVNHFCHYIILCYLALLQSAEAHSMMMPGSFIYLLC